METRQLKVKIHTKILVLIVSIISLFALSADTTSGTLNKFEFSRFASPESFYYPGYFWTWNDTLTKDLITSQLNDMNLHGARNIVPVPMPKDFRPATQPTLLEPDYMTPAYLDFYRYAVKECQRLNMKLWLYDEGGWPSGSCLGKVVAQNPSLARQSLIRQIIVPDKGSTYNVPADCLSAFLYNEDKRTKQLIPGSQLAIDTDNSKIMVFTVNKGGNYPDLLKYESTREFLKLTHKEYKKYINPYFGNTIKITFTDEAKAANPGWTDDLADDFFTNYGYDLRNELPSIFEGDLEKDRKVRIDYFDWWSRRHADSYYGQIREWCHQNNLLSGGHLDGEDATINARKSGFGHVLRALRKMDIPGVDVIWRQLWPGNKNHHFPKYASSVSHQSGIPWSFSESFAVYGNGLTPAQMKWISDYQYVRGINLLVISGYPQSNNNWFLGGLRPVFGPENPLWRYLDDYNGYIARLSYLLSLGKPDIRIALYYPVRDIWAGGSEVDSVCASNDKLARVLLENQCDFDFIDDDLLESDSVKISNRQLVVGQMHYDAVCVSRSRYMSGKSISKLEEFINGGGKVIWADNSNGAGKPKGITEAVIARVPSYLNPTIKLGSPNVNIRVCKRTIANGSIYFVTNEDTCETSGSLMFDESLPMLQLDPETGRCWKPSGALFTSGGWSVKVNLGFAGSCVFIFTGDKLPLLPEPSLPGSTLQVISEGWTARRTTGFEIGEHNIEIHEHLAEKPANVIPGEWKNTIGDDYSGDVEYAVSFKSAPSVIKNASVLDLGNVHYVCQATLNGQALGKRLWEPFTYDIKGKIRENNVLSVTVTNTLANQYIFNTGAFEKWSIKQLGPYHIRQLAFEKESLSGGLLGPVTLK